MFNASKFSVPESKPQLLDGVGNCGVNEQKFIEEFGSVWKKFPKGKALEGVYYIHSKVRNITIVRLDDTYLDFYFEKPWDEFTKDWDLKQQYPDITYSKFFGMDRVTGDMDYHHIQYQLADYEKYSAS